VVGWRGEVDRDRVAGADVAGGHHDAHDPGQPDQVAVVVVVEDGAPQPLVDAVELAARVAQAGDLDHRVGAEAEAGAGGQAQQVDAAGGHVLAHPAGLEREAGGAELVVELGVDEVDLAPVGLGRVGPDPGAVLDGHAAVGVALHPEAGQQPHDRPVRLRHRVPGAAAHRRHHR
jgi:hypothetical protein